MSILVVEKSAPVVRRFPGSIFVASRSSGAGGRVITQIIERALYGEEIDIDIFSVDGSKRSSASKLKRILAKTQDLYTVPHMAEVLANPSVTIGSLDPIGELMSRGGGLYDFAPNVAARFFQWAAISALSDTYGELPAVTLVVPVIADRYSVAEAIGLITGARKSRGELPVKKVVIVYNEVRGVFSDEVPGHAELKALEAEHLDFAVASIVLKRLRSEIWGKMQLHEMSFGEALDRSPEELSEKFGLGILKCARGKRFLRTWLEQSIAEFKAVGLSS